jgi:hypothetical protein
MTAMPPADASLKLASLDAAPTRDLDPAPWEANLAALRRTQPQLARTLEQVSLPTTWRNATALDGAPTFRTETSDDPPTWFAGTAAPATRARALAGGLDLRDRNLALPAIGHPALVAQLLSSLPAHVALYVFERDTTHLAAALRLVDLSAGIRAIRCILVPPSDEEAWLTEWLSQHPGLMPPGTVAFPMLASLERCVELRQLSERVSRRVLQYRNDRLAELVATPTPAASDPPRLAVLALRTDPLAHAVSAGLAAAAAAAGWPIHHEAVRGPADMHSLAQVERVAAFGPTQFVAVGHGARSFPLGTNLPRASWLLAPAHLPDASHVGDGRLLVATSELQDQLRGRGVAAELLPCAYDPSWERDARHDLPAGLAADVVLLGEIPAETAAVHGVTQLSQVRLWDAALKIARQAWSEPALWRPGALLERAQRATDIRVQDPELRTRLGRRCVQAVLPRAAIESVVAACRSAQRPVHWLGPRPIEIGGATIAPLGNDLTQVPAALADRGCPSCVLVGGGPLLLPALPTICGVGCPLYVRACQDPATARIPPELLRSGKHYVTFRDTRDLLRQIQYEGSATARAAHDRVAAARQHVLARHTYQQRLEELTTWLASRS